MNPTLNSTSMTIFDMCQNIESQMLSLPLYQRDLSWTIDKCVDLLNYQMLGKAPVAPISINVINKVEQGVPQVSFITRDIITSIQRGQLSVVDGQQRLTTNYKAYSDSNDFRNIVLDLVKGKFIVNEGSILKCQIPVGKLLNKDDTVFYNYANSNKSLNNPDAMTALLQTRSKAKNYLYTINKATDLNEDEQIEWFEVLNNAGSRVSIIQMRFSKLKAHGIDIYKDYTALFNEKLIQCGYNFFTPEKTTVSYPIAALNPAYEKIMEKSHNNNYAPISSDTKENQLCNLDPKILLQCFDLTLKAEDAVIDFISNHKIPAPSRIEYINYMIGYMVFKSNNFTLSNLQEQELIDWYMNVKFNNTSNSTRRTIYTKLIS